MRGFKLQKAAAVFVKNVYQWSHSRVCISEGYVSAKGMYQWSVCISEGYVAAKCMYQWRVCSSEGYVSAKGMYQRSVCISEGYVSAKSMYQQSRVYMSEEYENQVYFNC